MDFNELKRLARERMNGVCNLCKECNGVYCSGKVPGMGGAGTGKSFKRNYDALENVKLSLKTIHNSKNPDTSLKIFGKNLALPLMIAPITGSDINMGGYLTEEEYIEDVIFGAMDANTFAMIGDSAKTEFYDAGLDIISKANGCGMAIVKPRANDKIIENIKNAQKSLAIGVGVDIDGAGLITMELLGQPVGPKTVDELKELVQSTKLPFILKGIMSIEEAKLALEVGASAIVVSNHGGRILDHTLGVAEVLPSIARELKGKITILADGCVRTGVDILKYISLGADAVLLGRPAIWASIGGRREGVTFYINKLKNELRQAMILTGCDDIKSIDDSKIINLNQFK